eukprot:5116795-Pleurochrysis_carterae.AAC.1
MSQEGLLLTATDAPGEPIRVWDVERELCVARLPMPDEVSLRAMCAETESGTLVGLGFADGLVQLVDRRARAGAAPAASMLAHANSAVTHLSMRQGSGGEALLATAASTSVKMYARPLERTFVVAIPR